MTFHVSALWPSWRLMALIALQLVTAIGCILLASQAHAMKKGACSPEDAASIGRMLIVKITETGETPEGTFAQWLQDRPAGGIYLSKKFTRHLKSPALVANYIAGLQRDRSDQLFVSIDQEGGLWQTFDETNGFAPIKAAADICEELSGEPLEVYVEAQIGRSLAEVGVNMNFAPVLDVALDARSEIITKSRRACSQEPEEVAAYGLSVSQGLSKIGVIPVGKHFPGHGGVSGDTHTGTVRSAKSLEQLEREDLVPFKSYIAGAGDAIMVSHVVLDKLDPTVPASLSRVVVTDLLRKGLGFDGLVITDDMSMRGVKNYVDGDVAEAVRLAVLAGVDVAVLAHSNYDGVVERLCAGLWQPGGAELRARVETANRRIVALKRQFGLHAVED